jgi:putative transport protein
MSAVADLLTKNPELAVFLAIGIGSWAGSFKYKGVGLGPVTGSLLAGVVLGIFFHVPVSDTAKSLLFLLFMFGIGYSAGPGFVRGIREGGWRWVVFGILVPTTGLLTATVMAWALKLELGFAAGLMSGGLTESPIIGTASEAISSLPITDDEKARLIAQIPVADALTYIFGTLGVILFCAYIGPWLLRVDLKAAALKLEADLGIKRGSEGVTSAWHTFELRAYRVEAHHPSAGQTVAQAEAAVAPERLFVERIRRGDIIQTPSRDLVLQAGDVVAVLGRHEALVDLLGPRASEVADRELLDVPQARYDVLVQKRELSGRTLADIARDWSLVRGVFLRMIRRGDAEIPVSPSTVVHRGDIVTLVGLQPAVERAARLVGRVVLPTASTDAVILTLGIVFGAVIGLSLILPVGGLHIALGSSVGTLLIGLLVGWRNSINPAFGHIPPAAVELMKSIGLTGFVAAIGLKAGPVFVDALLQIGATVFLAGIVVTLVPQLVGLLIGRYVLRIDPILLLGALAGAQTMTAGLAAVQERSESPVAVIGYSSVVAFGHVLLTLYGAALIYILY